MHRMGQVMRGVSATALLVMVVSPALAFPGKGDRAQAAIAEATGKVDAANKAGVGGQVPALQARAQAALKASQEDVAAGNKEQAIADANHASELADMAIGEANRNRTEAEHARNADAAASTAAAQQDAAAAQQQAAAANARADSAQQQAAAASAQADALRNAPPPTTTVTTVEKDVHTTPARPITHKVVHRTVQPATTAEKTTTTVTTAPNPGG
jgi:hypothetical protein